MEFYNPYAFADNLKKEQRGDNDGLEFEDDSRERDEDSLEADNVKHTGRFGPSTNDPYKFAEVEAKDMQMELSAQMFKSP